jgi:hypothetical protein
VLRALNSAIPTSLTSVHMSTPLLNHTDFEVYTASPHTLEGNTTYSFKITEDISDLYIRICFVKRFCIRSFISN